MKWLASTAGLYLSVITTGEIAKGIAKQRRQDTAEAIARADALQAWLEGLLADYADRILQVDVAIKPRVGDACAMRTRPLPTDMLLAATALDHGLTIATRNVDHFRPTGVPVLNPFSPTGRGR